VHQNESICSGSVSHCLYVLFIGFVHDFVLLHFAMCTSVNCFTCVPGMMLNCIRISNRVCGIKLGIGAGANVIKASKSYD